MSRWAKSTNVRKFRGASRSKRNCNEHYIVKKMTDLVKELYNSYEKDPLCGTVRTVSYNYILGKLDREEFAKDFISYINPCWDKKKDGDLVKYMIDRNNNRVFLTPNLHSLRARFWIALKKRSGEEKANRVTGYMLKVGAGLNQKAYGVIFFYKLLGYFIQIPDSKGEYTTVFE